MIADWLIGHRGNNFSLSQCNFLGAIESGKSKFLRGKDDTVLRQVTRGKT